MRIALDAAPWSLTSFGCQVYIRELLQALRLSYPEHHFDEWPTGTSTSTLLSELQRLSLYEHLQLPRQLRKSKADVLHSPVYQIPLSSPCPVVVTVHDLFAQEQPHSVSPLARHWMNGVFPRLLPQVSQVIVISEFTKREFLRWYPEFPKERVHRVYHGIHPRFRVLETEEKTTQRQRWKHTKPFLLSVATLEPRKNLLRLLQAFSRLKDEFPHDLLFVGAEGRYHREFNEHLALSGLEGRVHLTGPLSPDELVSLYNLAALFVFPTLYEGFGFPVLEAQACGCPVVCSSTSSVGELAGKAPWLVEPRSVDSITQGIRAALETSELQARVEEGVKHAAQFQWERCAKETMEVYKAALT